MPNFAVYNYNFLRIIEPGNQLSMELDGFSEVDVEESFKNKQKILGEILDEDFKQPKDFTNAKKKSYWHKQIIKPRDDIYALCVANVAHVTITDESLKVKKYDDYRTCYVVIDNHQGVQRILIEQKSKAFKETKTAANILETSLNNFLRPYRLKVKLDAVYDSRVFKQIVERYDKGFSKVNFHFPPLNLERLTKVMDKVISQVREDWDSNLDFTLAGNNGKVKIDFDNKRQMALVQGASGAGVWIKMYPVELKGKCVYCGKNEFVTIIIDKELLDDLVSDKMELPGIGELPFDKLKIILRNIPNSFNQNSAQ